MLSFSLVAMVVIAFLNVEPGHQAYAADRGGMSGKIISKSSRQSTVTVKHYKTPVSVEIYEERSFLITEATNGLLCDHA